MIASEQVRTALGSHGNLRSQPLNEWKGEIVLPTQLATFYDQVGPDNITIPAHGNPYFFPRLSELWAFQAGYRWNGLTNERLSDWKEDWIVVADEGGDPFIYSCESGAILLAMHGAGVWKPEQIFPDTNTLAACLGTIGIVVLEAGQEFLDEDFMIEERYLKKIANDLTLLLGSETEATAILWNLGFLQEKPPHCK